MTELEAYKWLNSEERFGIEYSWRGENLLVWVQLSALEDFMEMFGVYFEDRVSEDISMSSTDVCFNFDEILDFFGIDPENIEEREDDNY